MKLNSILASANKIHGYKQNFMTIALCTLFCIFGTSNIPVNSECLIGSYLVHPGQSIEVTSSEIRKNIDDENLPEVTYTATCVKTARSASVDEPLAATKGSYWSIWHGQVDDYRLVLEVSTADHINTSTVNDHRFHF